MNQKTIKKFLIRWTVVNVIFVSVKLSFHSDSLGLESFIRPTALFYYVTAFILLMTCWELNDRLILKTLKSSELNWQNALKICFQTLVFMLPFAAVLYYIGLFPFHDWMTPECENPVQQFGMDMFRAFMITATIMGGNLFYFANKQRETMKEELKRLRQEVLASQYTSLKNQISPHFLFNSLNTLTALMYEDRDLASDFVTRLAASYRYILDNRTQDLVPLRRELGFMDSFVFMMEIRHQDAVKIKMNVQPETQRLLLPTLSLQMLVENALKHNSHSPDNPLEIEIKTIDAQTLVVRNNLQQRASKEESTGVGLQNIKNRYAYYTNKDVVVREEPTYFEVILPLLPTDLLEHKLKALA